MNEKRVIKALQCCRDAGDCDCCPYNGRYQCFDSIKRDALKIIIRQKKEIESLKNNELAREIFAEIKKTIGEKYNHYVFGNNDLDSLEQDAIINFSDTLSDCFADLEKKYTEGNVERAKK